MLITSAPSGNIGGQPVGKAAAKQTQRRRSHIFSLGGLKKRSWPVGQIGDAVFQEITVGDENIFVLSRPQKRAPGADIVSITPKCPRLP